MMGSTIEAQADTRYVYRFGGGVSDGGKGDKNLLGGKGANLAEMASIGLPVPPGFTVSTAMCARYYDEGESFPPSLRDEVAHGIAHIESVTGKRFGDPADPLLVSVRSGARVSMPARIHNYFPARIPGRPTNRLNQRSLRPQKSLLVRIQYRHQSHFRQVKSLAQQVHPNHNIINPEP